MSIFISADPQVTAQYSRLEGALRNRLPRKGEMNKRVRAYVRDELLELSRRVPWAPDGSKITEEGARSLCERFRDSVSLDVRDNKTILTAGGVSFYFSSLVYYVLGRSKGALTPLQTETLLEICRIADTRPLPVMRWTAFVRSHVGDVARIRTVMQSCIYSKTRQRARFSRVIASLKPHILAEKENIRVLAIGSSGTVIDALKGLSDLAKKLGDAAKIDLFLTRPTPGVALDPNTLGFTFEHIDENDLSADSDSLAYDLVIMGCGVIGKTADNRIEIVNRVGEIAIANRLRRSGAQLIVVGGLYKIWPQSFYRSHKEIALNKIKETTGLEATSILSHRDIDWLVTEHEAVSFRGPDMPPWLEFLFGAQSLDVTTSLSLVANEKSGSEEAFIQSILGNEIIRDIDKKLGLLSGKDHSDLPRHADTPAAGYIHDMNEMVGAGERFHPDSLEMAVKAFKIGLLLTIVGFAFWALFLASNKMTLAFWASAIAAVGANITMLAVLGDRRGAA